MQVLDPQAPATVTHDARPVLCDRPKRLQELVADAIAVRHYSRRTREAYWHWIKRFILWSGKRHPRDMGQVEVGQFLTWLASNQKVSASTQRQALAAVPARWVDACRCAAHRGVLTALREARRPSAGITDVATWLSEAQQRMREHLGDMEAGLCFNLPESPSADVVDLFSAPSAAAKRPRKAVRTPTSKG